MRLDIRRLLYNVVRRKITSLFNDAIWSHGYCFYGFRGTETTGRVKRSIPIFSRINYFEEPGALTCVCFNYRPQTKLREGYVFTGVCHSVNRGGLCIPVCLAGLVNRGGVYPSMPCRSSTI